MKFQLATCMSLLASATASVTSAQNVAPTPAAGRETVEEIIVTAEKFGRTQHETATSVSHVGTDDIEAAAMLTGRDVFERLVNVNTAGANGRFAIRGVAFDNITGAGFGALGTLYVDNVRMSDKSTRFGPDLLWDVQSVEVLRGAQSTLQGRNALAGAIYIKSEDPTFDWQAKARAMAFDAGGRDLAAAVGGPITDVLAFRISAEAHQSDGFVDNPVLKTDEVDYADDTQVRGKLLFAPRDDLTVRLNLNYADIERRDAPSDTRALGSDGYLTSNPQLGAGFETGVTGVSAAERRRTFVNIPEYDTTETTAGALIVDWRLNPALTFISETSAMYSDNYKQRDGDGGYYDYDGYSSLTMAVANPFGIGDFAYTSSGSTAVDPVELQHETHRIRSQEFRLKYDGGGPLRGLGGVYYMKESEREDNFSLLVFRNLQPLVSSTAAGYGVSESVASLFASFYSNDAPLYTYNAQPVDVENYAGYGEVEYDLTDRLTVDAGLRYDHENNTSRVVNSGEVLGLADLEQVAALDAALGALAAGINAALDPFAEAQSSASQSFDAWLPKLSIRYRVNDEVTVGAVAQRAYRAGGVSVNVVRQLVTPLLPEYTWNYELFLRSDLFDRRARLNANVYYVDWKDQQVVIDLSDQETDSIGANAGNSVLYGFEAQLDVDVAPGFKAYAGLGYSHTEFVDFNVTVPAAASALGIAVDPDKLDALEGKSFAYAPKWTAVLGGSWQSARGVFASANINYQGKSYADTANTQKNDARALTNVRVGYDFGKVSASIFARNLFDVDYVKDASSARPLLGEPRTVGLVVEARY